MENVQNKEVKAGEGHQSGGCHCALCSWKGGGWHGRHSVLRVAIGVGIILGAFCLGTAVGDHRGDDRGRRGGYGEGKFERHMDEYGRYQDPRSYGDQPMMGTRQGIIKTTASPATGTQMMIQQ